MTMDKVEIEMKLLRLTALKIFQYMIIDCELRFGLLRHFIGIDNANLVRKLVIITNIMAKIKIRIKCQSSKILIESS